MPRLRPFRRPQPGSSPTDSSDTAEPRKSDGDDATTRTRTCSAPTGPPRRWRIHWFRGMWRDVERRAPFYVSDWLDAWDYRVVPATVYMFFAKYVVSVGEIVLRRWLASEGAFHRAFQAGWTGGRCRFVLQTFCD